MSIKVLVVLSLIAAAACSPAPTFPIHGIPIHRVPIPSHGIGHGYWGGEVGGGGGGVGSGVQQHGRTGFLGGLFKGIFGPINGVARLAYGALNAVHNCSIGAITDVFSLIVNVSLVLQVTLNNLVGGLGFLFIRLVACIIKIGVCVHGFPGDRGICAAGWNARFGIKGEASTAADLLILFRLTNARAELNGHINTCSKGRGISSTRGSVRTVLEKLTILVTFITNYQQISKATITETFIIITTVSGCISESRQKNSGVQIIQKIVPECGKYFIKQGYPDITGQITTITNECSRSNGDNINWNGNGNNDSGNNGNTGSNTGGDKGNTGSGTGGDKGNTGSGTGGDKGNTGSGTGGDKGNTGSGTGGEKGNTGSGTGGDKGNTGSGTGGDKGNTGSGTGGDKGNTGSGTGGDKGNTGSGTGGDKGNTGSGTGGDKGNTGSGTGGDKGNTGSGTGGDKGNTGSGTGGDKGNTGSGTGGDKGNTGSGTGGDKGNTGSGTGGDKGNTGSSTGGDNENTGGSTGSDTGNTGSSTGGDSGNTGSSTGGDNGNTGSSTGGDNGNTGSSTGGDNGNTGSSTGGDNGNTGSGTGGDKGNTGSGTGGDKGNTGSGTGGDKGNTGSGTGGDKGNTGSGTGGDKGNTGSSTGGDSGNTGSSTGGDNENTGGSTGSDTGNTGSSTGGDNGNTGSSTGGDNGNTGSSTGGDNGNTGSSTGGDNGNTGSSTGGDNGNTGSSTGGDNGNTGSSTGGDTGNTGSSTGSDNGNTGSSTGGDNGNTGSSTSGDNGNTGSSTGGDNGNTGSSTGGDSGNTGGSTGSDNGNTGSSTGGDNGNTGSSTGGDKGNTGSNTGGDTHNDNGVDLGVSIGGIIKLIPGVTSISSNIINEIIKIKINTFLDIVNLVTKLAVALGGIIDSIISGLGSILIRIVAVIFKIGYCVNGLGSDKSICTKEWNAQFGITGDATTAADLISLFRVHNCKNDVATIVSTYTNGKGISSTTGAINVILQKVTDLSVTVSSGTISNENLSSIFVNVISIFGSVTNSYKQGCSTELIQKLIPVCAPVLIKRGLPDIRTQLKTLVSTIKVGNNDKFNWKTVKNGGDSKGDKLVTNVKKAFKRVKSNNKGASITAVLNLQAPRNFDDVCSFGVQVVQALGGVLDVFIKGLGTLIARIVGCLLNYIVAVLGAARNAKSFVSQKAYFQSFGVTVSGSTWADLAAGFKVNNAKADLDGILKAYTNNKGLKSLSGVKLVLFNCAYSLVDIVNKGTGIVEADLTAVFRVVTTIIGGFANSCSANVGKTICDNMLPTCSFYLEKNGYPSLGSQSSTIDSTIDTCNNSDAPWASSTTTTVVSN